MDKYKAMVFMVVAAQVVKWSRAFAFFPPYLTVMFRPMRVAHYLIAVAAGHRTHDGIAADQVLLTFKHKVAQSISADVTAVETEDVVAGEIEEAETMA